MGITDDFLNTFKRDDNGLAKVIIVNAIVFILVNLIGLFTNISIWFTLPSSLSELALKPWTVITYMFLHTDFFHILFNMLWLFWLGRLFIDFLGSKRFVSLYILGGLAGAALYLISSYFFVRTGFGLLGASASVMAITVSIAFFIPNYSIIFFIWPVPLKYIALISFILTTVLDFNINTGGKIAHVGGAVLGYIFISYYKRGTDITKPLILLLDKLNGVFNREKSSKIKVVYSKTRAERSNAERQLEIDKILDKISKSGYESLTKEEKEILFHASKRS